MKLHITSVRVIFKHIRSFTVPLSIWVTPRKLEAVREYLRYHYQADTVQLTYTTER